MKSETDAVPSNSEELLFNAALALPAKERAAYLQGSCGADLLLRTRIENLLRAYGQSDGFLETPPGTVTILTPPAESAGDVIGRYKIREKLGEGGCGVVYVAEQSEPVRRRVALKVIKLGMDTLAVTARFEAERQALAMMDHPNIAKVLDAGTTEKGRPYFVMELVRGIRMTDYCDQHNLDTPERIRLFIQVCQAVQHAHQKGIIHRDIKPSNILVTLHDHVPVPKVIDFGIAKAIEGRLTEQTVYTQLYEFIGTPAYISPEQAEMSGLDIDTRSDIYSLGVLLYELLTGKTPFDAQELLQSGLDAMRRTIREQEPLAPSTRLKAMGVDDLTATAKRRRVESPRLVHLIKGDLDWIVMKALEKDRTRRYETANALAADLQRFLKNEPVEARPPSNIYRLQKMVRRNKAAFAAVFGILGILIVSLAVSLNLYFKEKDALRRTVQAEAGKRKEMEARLQLERQYRTNGEVGQELWKAGVLMSQGQFADAENLIQDVPLIPQVAALFNVLGAIHAREGQFGAAISNYVKGVTAQPTNEFALNYLLPLLAFQNRKEEFARWRDTALSHFDQTEDPKVAELLALNCLLEPASTEGTKRILMMLDRTDVLPHSPTHDLARGLLEYRQGQFERAAASLQQAADSTQNTTVEKQARILLSMAREKLGQPAGSSGVNANGLTFYGTDWNENMATAVLAREAGVQMTEITQLLQAIDQGDSQNAEQLLPLVYEELRRLAASKMAREPAGHTLQATALVHEAWMRLTDNAEMKFSGRAHFFGAAAEAMRRILIDRARRKAALRHGGGLERENINEIDLAAPLLDGELLAVNEALDKLSTQHPQKAELVKLRFFTGLTIEQAAEALAISEPTAKRWWAYARAWLFEECRTKG